jgi:hypothetical protein
VRNLRHWNNERRDFCRDGQPASLSFQALGKKIARTFFQSEFGSSLGLKVAFYL